ncbi:hypothetical protein DITRI_Ditri15bG0025200 [Diplodiscus trichospermus]
MVYDSAMNLASKIGSFFSKIRRSSKLKHNFLYNRLVDQSDNGVVVKAIDKAPRIYVSVYVGKEAKRYDVPLRYLSLPRFRLMVMRSHGNDLDINLDRPIIVDCTPEFFELLLEHWSFKWDYNEENHFNFLKKVREMEAVGTGILTAHAARRTTGERDLSFSH